MIRDGSNESGWTLIELLVAMTLMLIVLSATLTSFNAFSNTSKRNFDFNDQQDQVRNTMDQIVRQARNLANPTTGSTGIPVPTIAFASKVQLVFQTTDPKKQWVRYCLNTNKLGSTTARESIWYQTTANNLLPTFVASNMISDCPSDDTNWQTRTKVGDFVTNATTNPTRSLFKYYSDAAPGTAITPDPTTGGITDTSQIVRAAVSIFMKLKPNRPPAETELDSAAYMRNQNQPPVAAFSAQVSGTTYTFDGGSSSDPEGRTLLYDWYLAPHSTSLSVPSPTSLPSCGATNPQFPTSGAGSGWSCLGTTVVVGKAIDPAAPKYVFLRVTDPGGLQTMSSFPAGGCATATDLTRTQTQCGGART